MVHAQVVRRYCYSTPFPFNNTKRFLMRRYLNDDCLMSARQPSCAPHRWSLPIPASSLGPKDSYQPPFSDECWARQAAGDQEYGIPSPSSSASYGSLPSSPSDMAVMSPNYNPPGGSHMPDFCEEPLRSSPERLSGRPNSFYWQEVRINTEILPEIHPLKTYRLRFRWPPLVRNCCSLADKPSTQTWMEKS